eukprot:scaffold48515_cov32-Tisochrysis_lutea.AAC.2
MVTVAALHLLRRRVAADDGFCEFETSSGSVYKPLDARPRSPVCREPGDWYSPFLGGGVQRDGRSKTRVSPRKASLELL